MIQGDYNAPRRQAPVARRQPGRHRGPGGRQEDRPGGPQEAPRRAPAERLRLRSDLAPRDLPVGRHVHRHAHRDELLHRRRRAGQGARQRDLAGPGDARRAPPGDRGHALPDERPAPGRRPPRSGPSTRACASSTTAKAALKQLEKRTAAALASQKRTYAAIERNKAAAKAALAKAAAAQKKLKDQIAALIRKQLQGGNIPSAYNGTLTWPMSGDVTQNFGCTGFYVGAALRVMPALPPGHRHRRPVRHAGEGIGRRDGRVHRLELRRRRRPGLDRDHRPQRLAPDLVRAHAAALPGRDPRRQRGDPRPGHRLRRQHGPFDRRPPPLGGRCSTGISPTRVCSCRASSPV